MLKQRVITALILLPLVFALFFIAPISYFAASFTVIGYLLALEWAKLSGYQLAYQHSIFALLISGINLSIWYYSGHFVMWPSPSWPQALVWDYAMIILGLATLAILLCVFIVLTYSSLTKWWANKAFLTLLGAVIIPAFFISMISIRSSSYLTDFAHGSQLLLLMFCLVWAADTGAYFTGKAFGKHKLAPVVSPNKTWEGAAGGFILSILVAWFGVSFIGIEIENKFLFIFVVMLLAMFSVIGDLFESAMKRVANIKDSGNLLPGHGGVLDRLDSALVVAPLFFLSFSFLGWFR